MDFSVPGPEKKARVMKELNDIGGAAGEAVSEITPHLLSMGVDIVVANLKDDIEQDNQDNPRNEQT